MSLAAPIPPELNVALAGAADRLGAFAGRVSWLPEVASTNDLALQRAEAGEDEGCVIVADAQVRGRGRLGRVWTSPPGAGVYASVLLRPTIHVSLLTLAAGVGIAEGIAASTGLRPLLKWPNDLHVPAAAGPWRKLGGILAEGGTSADGRAYVVAGFGINIRPAAYPEDIASRATSLEQELGRPVDRWLVLAECLAALWARYGDLQSDRAAAVLDAWRSLAGGTFGRRVEWDAGGRVHSGVIEDVDETGALLVRTPAGAARVISGDVRWAT
jgi:BirA family biotin operon repressor/biotin-[acetyl-CoA-carboxylase] ligase